MDKHNRIMLEESGVQVFECSAEDSSRDKATNLLRVKLPDKASETGGLPKIVQLAVSAKVMLTYNISVSDGLVNGACGQIRDIVCTNGKVDVVLVEFDHPDVGREAKLASSYRQQWPDVVPIRRVTSTFPIGKRKGVEVERTQFPLVMCYGQTIHKVQGRTVDRVIVDMTAGRFQAGQVYVAFSRARKMSGLRIIKFDPKKIRVDEKVMCEMDRMRTSQVLVCPCCPILDLLQNKWLKLAHLNISGLLMKTKYLVKDETLTAMDILCFSETWLETHHEVHIDALPISNPVMFRVDRSLVPHLADLARGGTMIASSGSYQAVMVTHMLSLEAVHVQVVVPNELKISVISVYKRPEEHNVTSFITGLQNLLDETVSDITVIVGDFNLDVLQGKATKLTNFMKIRGFKQLVNTPTTNKGTCIDLAFINSHVPAKLDVRTCYYTDHHKVIVAIPI